MLRRGCVGREGFGFPAAAAAAEHVPGREVPGPLPAPAGHGVDAVALLDAGGPHDVGALLRSALRLFHWVVSGEMP